eukprot:1068392_1
MSATTLTTDPGFLGDAATDEFLWLVVLSGVVCFAMAWGIGANDVANAFATSVGAKAITLKQALVIAGIFEFVGAVALGANVTNTIRKKITNFDAFIGEEDVLMLGMFCALASGALWLALASKYSLPVSTTHSIIGAIIGFSVAAKGVNAVDWVQVAYIVLFWIVAPFGASIMTMCLFAPIRALILRKSNSYQLSLHCWPLFVFIVAFVMCFFMIAKGLKRIDFDYEESLGLTFAITGGVSAGCALLSYLLLIRTGAVNRYVQNYLKAAQEKQTAREMAKETAKEKEKEKGTLEELQGLEIHDKSKVFGDGDRRVESGSQRSLKSWVTHGANVDIHDDMEQLERDIHDNSEKFDPQTERSFAWLQVCTASLGAFAHGSNDVANAVAPFAAIVGLYETGMTSSEVAVPVWILGIGAIGIVIGLATYGYKVMQTLGVRMVYVSSTRGYCIELSSATIIICASAAGFPASTTHAQVGATVGVGLMEKARKGSTLTWGNVINWKLLAQVFAGWILTLVFTGLTSGCLYCLLAYSPYAGDVPKNCDV